MSPRAVTGPSRKIGECHCQGMNLAQEWIRLGTKQSKTDDGFGPALIWPFPASPRRRPHSSEPKSLGSPFNGSLWVPSFNGSEIES